MWQEINDISVNENKNTVSDCQQTFSSRNNNSTSRSSSREKKNETKYNFALVWILFKLQRVWVWNCDWVSASEKVIIQCKLMAVLHFLYIFHQNVLFGERDTVAHKNLRHFDRENDTRINICIRIHTQTWWTWHNQMSEKFLITSTHIINGNVFTL